MTAAPPPGRTRRFLGAAFIAKAVAAAAAVACTLTLAGAGGGKTTRGRVTSHDKKSVVIASLTTKHNV